jgi:hypothetical protein
VGGALALFAYGYAYQAVALPGATRGLPAVELEGHHQYARADDLGMGDDPFLQVRAFPQARLGERDGLYGVAVDLVTVKTRSLTEP